MDNDSTKIYPHPKWGQVYVEESDYCLYYLHAGQRVIGHASYRLNESDHKATLIDIVLTANEYRRKGIGSWMLDIICDSARRCGAESIEGTIYPENPRDPQDWEKMKMFYKSNGFEINDIKIFKSLLS